MQPHFRTRQHRNRVSWPSEDCRGEGGLAVRPSLAGPPGLFPRVLLGPFPAGLGWLVWLQSNEKFPFQSDKTSLAVVHLALYLRGHRLHPTGTKIPQQTSTLHDFCDPWRTAKLRRMAEIRPNKQAQYQHDHVLWSYFNRLWP